ncbi:MAG: glycosyltransferase [Alphaproteobacteria bacterium]|nr:glycosyltransferase [Alphaproteobacteria bacterium]
MGSTVTEERALVSVIIPTKNRDAYLRQAIDSIYTQTYRHFEIIVIDDGSSYDIKASLAGYDDRLHYYAQAAQGAAAARNHGLAKAKGEFVAFLDDDDLYLPARLERSVAAMGKHPDAVWLCSGFSFIDAKGAPLDRPPIIPLKTEVTLHDIAMFTFISTPSVLARRKALLRACGFPEGVKVSEDYHTWARVLALGKGLALPEVLVRVRLHPGNTKLPCHALLRENTRIIDYLLTHYQPMLMPRRHYIDNLYRIISENLRYKRKWLAYGCFHLHLFIRRAFDKG